MKKLCLIAIVAALLLPLEGLCESSLPFELTEYDQPFEMDLDGDGHMETLCWYRHAASEPLFTVESTQSFAPASLNFGDGPKDRIWLADLDGDGVIEILRSGDFASDDEFTSCRHYRDGDFEVLSFPEEYYSDGSYGNGTVYDIEGNALTLNGYLHLAGGSHYALRTYTLVDGRRFEPIDDGVYRFTFAVENPLSFENGVQKVLAEIPYKGTDGAEDGILLPGDVVILTATDNVERLWFTAADGRTGIISVWRKDESDEMDWRIGDMMIEDAIDGIIYAG